MTTDVIQRLLLLSLFQQELSEETSESYFNTRERNAGKVWNAIPFPNVSHRQVIFCLYHPDGSVSIKPLLSEQCEKMTYADLFIKKFHLSDDAGKLEDWYDVCLLSLSFTIVVCL